MYWLEKDIYFKNQRVMADEIGIAHATLNRILNRKNGCSKVMAYCITKAFNQDAEILDYFTKK